MPVLLVLLLAAGAAGQQPGEQLCGACKTTGRTAVPVDARFAVESEGGDAWKVRFCSDAIRAENMALSWEPCRRCKTPSLQAAAQAEWSALEKANLEWLAERRKVDGVVQVEADDIVHVETTHFVIAWTAPKISVDRKTLKMHEAAHLYARRLEEFHARFQALLGVADASNMKNRHFVMLFESADQALAAGPVFAGLSGMHTVKRAGGANQESTIVAWLNKSEHPKDEDLHRHLLHSMTHQLTAVYYDPRWFPPGTKGLSPPWLNDKYGWLDEGLAHWFEMDFDGQATSFCFREQDSTVRWKGQDWHKNVFKAVVAGEVPSFAETSTLPSQALSAQQHQFVWSWVDFLMARDVKAVGQAMKLAKQEVSARDILQQAFDLTTLQFEAQWIEWVKVQYAPAAREETTAPLRQRG